MKHTKRDSSGICSAVALYQNYVEDFKKSNQSCVTKHSFMNTITKIYGRHTSQQKVQGKQNTVYLGLLCDTHENVLESLSITGSQLGDACVMIRVNCAMFNMTAAHAQDAQLGIGGLRA